MRQAAQTVSMEKRKEEHRQKKEEKERMRTTIFFVLARKLICFVQTGALKNNDEEAYAKLVMQTKNQRLKDLLSQTDDYLKRLVNRKLENSFYNFFCPIGSYGSNGA